MIVFKGFDLAVNLSHAEDDKTLTNNGAEIAIPVRLEDVAERRLGSIRIQKRQGQALEISIPLAGADQLFYRHDQSDVIVSNDARMLHRTNDEIDDGALRSLLQFGAIVPPLTVWSPIRRFTPGHSFSIDPDTGSISDLHPTLSWADINLSANKQQASSDILSDVIDEILITNCPDRNPIIMFSGGVDSGVLAARASALGWKDTVLLNYAMHPNDIESLNAEAMADHLGLPFYRLLRNPAFGDSFLQRIGQSYRQPFTDISCIPTLEIANAAEQNFSQERVILDGTGADGGFGLNSKARNWKKLYQVPRSLRSASNYIYDKTAMWQRNSPIEYWLRLLARASDTPFPAAAIAQSSSRGVLIDMPACSPTPVEYITEWLQGTLPDNSAESCLSGLDLALVCSDRFAQKNKCFFDSCSRKIVYPFLENRIVKLALSQAAEPSNAAIPKYALKKLLARSVPDSFVSRPKTGFAPPIQEYLARPAFQEAIDRLLSGKLVVFKSINYDRIRKSKNILARAERLPATTLSIVWTAIFVNEWLRQHGIDEQPWPTDLKFTGATTRISNNSSGTL